MEIQASNVAERAAGIAKEIAANEPDLVSLQEVDLLRTVRTTIPATPATTVESDARASLMNALAALGEHYQVAMQLQEFDLQAPSSLGIDVRLTDFDVILFHSGASNLSFNNPQGQHYVNVISAPVPLPDGTTLNVPIPQGWVSVDVTDHGKTFRFVGTHLSAVPLYQVAQAGELLAGPVSTSLPVILAGDLNSAASGGPDVTDTYTNIRKAGLADAWAVAHPGVPGYTWPLHGEDPYSALSTPTERIDLVFSNGGLGVRDDVLVGNTTTSLTPSGLWPSDHAGVVASIKLGS